MNFVGQNLETLPPASGLATGQIGQLGPNVGTSFAGSGMTLPGLAADGISPCGFAGNGNVFGGQTGTPGYAGGGSQGGFLGLINSLIGQLSSLIGQLTGESNAEGPGTQTVSSGTFSSTGDPHLSETASVLNSAGNASKVNSHFDSMSSHDNLLSSQDFNGGYRLSTAVTAPNAKGVTMNASATLHLNNNQDQITMNNDGTVALISDGNTVSLADGQSVTLNGSEQVTRNADGSLTVLAQNQFGGQIATTLAARGGGVDATASVQNVTVGGDIAGGTANPTPTTATTAPLAAPAVYAGEIT